MLRQMSAPGTGPAPQPHMENNESSESLALSSVQKHTYIHRAIASEDSHSTIM